MNKLLKRFKVLHVGNRMILPLTEQGDNAEVYPGVGITYQEFDSYTEAKFYVDKNKLSYDFHY